MNFLDVILIGIALAMDACVVTISNCATYKGCLTKRKCIAMPITFGIFQGIMPLIGFFIGSFFFGYIEEYIGYLTSAIFLALALKIIFDIAKERKSESKESNSNSHKFSISLLFIQAIATSIDALAIGFSFSSLTFNVYLAVLTIAVVTFILVSIAMFLGNQVQKMLDKYADWIGAFILIILAVKTLIESIVA